MGIYQLRNLQSQENKLSRYLGILYESLPVEVAQNSLGGYSTAEVVACVLAKIQNY